MIGLLVIIAIIGLITYLLTAFIPMDGRIKTIIVVVAIIFIVLLVLQALGLLSGLKDVPVPRLQ